MLAVVFKLSCVHGGVANKFFFLLIQLIIIVITCGWTAGLAPRLKRKLNKLCNSNLLDMIMAYSRSFSYEKVILNKKKSKKFLSVTRL